MKRIDRILSEQTNYSRKEIKKLVSKGEVLVNGNVVRKPDEKYDEDKIGIFIGKEKISVNKHFYLLLNKPKGYVSTTISFTNFNSFFSPTNGIIISGTISYPSSS